MKNTHTKLKANFKKKVVYIYQPSWASFLVASLYIKDLKQKEILEVYIVFLSNAVYMQFSDCFDSFLSFRGLQHHVSLLFL